MANLSVVTNKKKSLANEDILNQLNTFLALVHLQDSLYMCNILLLDPFWQQFLCPVNFSVST